MKKFFAIIALIFMHRGALIDEAVDEGIVDLGGQGRNSYGK